MKTTGQNNELVVRNTNFLLGRFPELTSIISMPLSTQPVRDGEAVIDVNLGDARLYGRDGRDLSFEQVDSYMQKPLRFYTTDLGGTNISSKMSFRLFERFRTELAQRAIPITSLRERPQYDGGILIVLGLGLGYHLQRLIDKTCAKVILVVEPSEELLRHSLASIDWEDLFVRNESAGCKIFIQLARNYREAIQKISYLFTEDGAHFIDGAYVFVHYPSTILLGIRDNLYETAQVVYTSRGYHEDELLMLTNTTANIAASNAYVLDNKLRPERGEPVLIIGSGPSVDKCIYDIKRLRERAIVFSCGTGLRVCLSNGIVPDYHCELENGGHIYDVLSAVRSQFSFDGITLVAPFSVDPSVPPLFDEVILFFRDSISGSRILTSPSNEIYLAAPTVANTALRTAMSMGFGTFYLFGIDCGSKDITSQHSLQSVYFHAEMFKTDPRTDLNYTLRGNFGGTVKSNWVLMFSRMLIIEACRIFQPKVYNCSDGAEIPYTIPKVAAAVHLTQITCRGNELKQAMRKYLRVCSPETLLSGISFCDLKSRLNDYQTRGLLSIDEAKFDKKDFRTFWKHINLFLKENERSFAGIASMIDCTLKSMPKVGMFFIHRIADEGVRDEFYDIFIDEYRSIFIKMCDNVGLLLDELSGCYDAEGHESL